MESQEENTNETECRTFRVRIGKFRLHFNPVVTLVSALLIWGLVAWCIIDPDGTSNYMSEAKKWISDHFTWFYIGVGNCWLVFIIFVYFSKYSNIKLGKDDEKPEYSDASYFTMLFAAGVGIGLFYFGVAEPIFHYEPGVNGNRYWGRYSDNQRAQDAINITLFHWGLHAWVVYCVVGLCMAFVTFRMGLPMTIRYCFYPLLGNWVYGIVGDLIDIMSIVSTVLGVCTTLGLGAMTINSGVNRVNSNIVESITNQIIIIWIVTAMATTSVVTGLKLGVRRLSELCFGLGVLLMMLVLFYDQTFSLLNLYIQSIGYYLQNVIQLGFHTDAFAQLENAPDGKENPEWLDDWTIFYWGWWISWSPFVGMFIAKISRGRTIKSFINATLTAPIIYTFLWFSIFGGAGIIMERNAALKGINCTWELGGKNATEPFEQLFRLSCREKTQMYFDLLQQYGSISGFLNIISIAAIILYFVTSADSGSLVIDCLAANGNPDPPVVQRIFWALTEGACATALLKAGGKTSLTTLQTVSVAAGLPYAVILCLMCVSLWCAFRKESGDTDEHQRRFNVYIGDVFSNQSSNNRKRVIVSTFAPWWPAGRAAGKLNRKNPLLYMVFIAMLFYGWVLLEILQLLDKGMAYIGWVALCGFFAYIVGIRVAIREEYGISGSLIGDALVVVFLYPFAVDQLDKHMLIEAQLKKGDEPGICLENKHTTLDDAEQLADVAGTKL